MAPGTSALRRSVVETWDRMILAEYERLMPHHGDPRMVPWSFGLEPATHRRLETGLHSLERKLPAALPTDRSALRSVAVEAAVNTYVTALLALPESPNGLPGSDAAQLAPGIRTRIDPRRAAGLVTVDVRLPPRTLETVDATVVRILARDLSLADDAAWWVVRFQDELRSTVFAEAVAQWLAARAEVNVPPG